jgi:hypothetical protein
MWLCLAGGVLVAQEPLAPVALEPGAIPPGAQYCPPGSCPEDHACDPSRWFWAPPFFRHTKYGAEPHGGLPGAPSQYHEHYELPSKRYGLWFRPAAFAEERPDHCRSRPFAPRGYGVPHRHVYYQLDYTPYEVECGPSEHGPAYYHRRPLVPCKACLQHHH